MKKKTDKKEKKNNKQKGKGFFRKRKIIKSFQKTKSNSFSLCRTVFMESNYKVDRHLHLNLPRSYNAQVKRWFDGITDFGNVGSLLKVEIN